MMQSKKVDLIQVPFWLGCGRAGTELGPESMMQAGLGRQLKAIDGLALRSNVVIDCPAPAAAAGSGSAKAKYLQEVTAMSGLLCGQVAKSVKAGAFPLVLGGDHSIAIGSLAGLTACCPNLGVIWFDAHADLNTEDTTLSGNIHGMPLAVALGRSRFKLTDIPGAGPLLKKENLVIIGARDLDPAEKEYIRSEGITCFSMHEIDRMGIQAVVKEALEVAGNGTDGIHLSFDMDCLDPLEAPGVGTPVPGGLTYREAHFALELLAETKRITSMDLVEVNPLIDYNMRTARLATQLIASTLGKRIL
nr:arginase [Paenibacillus pinihumi]